MERETDDAFWRCRGLSKTDEEIIAKLSSALIRVLGVLLPKRSSDDEIGPLLFFLVEFSSSFAF